jgi:hypothetical protein
MGFVQEHPAAARFDAHLREHKDAVLDGVFRFLADAKSEGITTLTGVGLPLRPLVLPQAFADEIARALVGIATKGRDLVVDVARAGGPAAAAAAFGVPEAWVAAVDAHGGGFADALAAPWALSTMRPDGFLVDDAYRVSELNCGNGVLISTAYVSAVQRLYDRFLHWPDVAVDRRSAFVGLAQHLADVARRHALPGHPVGARPRLALLLPQCDCKTAGTWGEKVHQQLAWSPRLLHDAGFDVVVVNEDEIDVDAAGRAVTVADGAVVDVVYLATTGLGFFEDIEEERNVARMKKFFGPRIGHAPFVLPIAVLALEKGTLPAFSQLASPSPLVSVQPSEYPTRDRAPLYRNHQNDLVLKRSFRDKNTFVGVSTPPRQWNKMIDFVADSTDYIVQEFVDLPRVRLPVLLDERHIEWVEMRVELSPFLFGGALAGAMIRTAPDAPGLVLSPPPPGMGFGAVWFAPE